MSETETSFDRCRCCLEDGELRDLWGEYIRNGERTNYGEMIVNCFVLPWQQPSDYMEQICEVCIEKLQDAFSFKKKVLASELVLQQQMSYESENIEKKPTAAQLKIKVEPKSENPDVIKGHYSDEACEEENENVTYYVVENNADTMAEDSQDMSMEDGEYCEETMSSVNQDDESAEYLEVEFLDDCDNAAKQTTEETSTKRKWPKKKKKSEQMSTYKQYTKEDLQKAMEAVKNNLMSRSEAARLYNVPVKTLGSKLRVEATKIDNPGFQLMTAAQNKSQPFHVSNMTIQTLPSETKGNPQIAITRMRIMDKHHNNIRAILMYSNATPIRGHWGKGYACGFCSEQYPNPIHLKEHTVQNHDVNLRSKYMKEKEAHEFCVKLDITDLLCELCDIEIDTLDQLMKHLTDKHGIKIFDDIPDQILPFKFNSKDTEKLCCVICSSEFSYFKLLSEHMNEHYKNYECPNCDRYFVNKSSLRMHSYRHMFGEYPCGFCSKMFSTKSRKTQHERVVHILQSKAYRCGYCGERFTDSAGKNKHETEVHGAELKLFPCHACDNVYNRQRSLTDHINQHHLLIKPFKCRYCDKDFGKKRDLERHIVTHTGYKGFLCVVCPKAYATKSSLKEHVRIHNNDRRFHCEYCGEKFVQKVSLKCHVKSKHGDLDENE